MRLINLMFVLLINAVPLIGVKYHGWSASTVVLLYWVENLLIAVFTSARILLHRVLTRKRGHWRTGQLGTLVNNKPSPHGLLGEYAMMAFVFTLVHGFFVGVFISMASENHADNPVWSVSGGQLRQGAIWMAATMLLEFLVDAATIRSRSFAWIKTYVEQRMSRVLILHVAIIAGVGGMMLTDSPFALLYALIALKTLWGLATANASADAETAAAQPFATATSTGAAGRKGTGARAQAGRKPDVERGAAALEDEQVMPA
ncbi:MAG: DUF6498-containing protein [Rudaea sp.]